MQSTGLCRLPALGLFNTLSDAIVTTRLIVRLELELFLPLPMDRSIPHRSPGSLHCWVFQLFSIWCPCAGSPSSLSQDICIPSIAHRFCHLGSNFLFNVCSLKKDGPTASSPWSQLCYLSCHTALSTTFRSSLWCASLSHHNSVTAAKLGAEGAREGAYPALRGGVEASGRSCSQGTSIPPSKMSNK